MTRQEAIDIAKEVTIELNQKPHERGTQLPIEDYIVSVLIALGILTVEG